MFQLAVLLSINTGSAPRYRTGFAEAAKVRSEQKASSPGPTPNNLKPRWIAAVPLDKHTEGSPILRLNSSQRPLVSLDADSRREPMTAFLPIIFNNLAISLRRAVPYCGQKLDL